MMEWISCKERMPEIIPFDKGGIVGASESVLTVDINSDEDPEVQYLRKGGRGDLTTEYWSGHTPNVTHWMPIPKLKK